MQRPIGAMGPDPAAWQLGCGHSQEPSGFEGNQQQEKGAPSAAKEDTKDNITPFEETARVWKVKFSQNGTVRMDGTTEQME